MAYTYKTHNGTKYISDKDFDYTTAINEAVANGDNDYAGVLEKKRNAKIDGEGLSYAKTYKYTNPDGSAKPSDKGYSSQYGGMVGNMLSKIMNREKFDYDYTKDDSYKALEEVYKANGKYAMQDTLGDAAALTGGRASSAAVSASQQAYNRYMQQLAENIPALEQAAYARYRDEGNELYNQMNILMGLDDRDYSRYIDDRNYNYQLGRDQIKDSQWEQNFGLQLRAQEEIEEQNNIDNDHWEADFNHRVSEDDENKIFEVASVTGDYSGLLEQGYSQDTVDALNAAHAKGVAAEEMTLALQRAQIAAQYGIFTGFEEAGFSEETVAQMKAYWDKGQLTEDALVAAQFGDLSKLSALGITPKVTKGKGDDPNIDEDYYSYIADYETGGMTYQDLIDFSDDYISVIGNEKYVELLAEIQTREEKKNKLKKEEVYYDYAAFVQSGKLTYKDLTAGGNADNINKILGDEYYIKLCEYAKEIESDYSNF